MYFIKLTYKNKYNIVFLPPTEAAARQHSFQTYHQVQQWYEIEKHAEQWGWKNSKNGLSPITMVELPALETLLKLISCKCKKRCLWNQKGWIKLLRYMHQLQRYL